MNNANNAQNAAGAAAAQNGPPPPQPLAPAGLPVGNAGAAGVANPDPHSTCVDPKNNPFCKDPLLNHVNEVFIANGVPRTH